MFKDGFDLPEKHADLRHGVFGIGGNGLAMPAQNHELAAGAGIRASKPGARSLRMKSSVRCQAS